jgi:glutamate 5-kinase
MRIVVKVGTSTVTGGAPQISAARLVDLMGQVALAHKRGHVVAIVSSGAIAAGRDVLGFPTFPKHIPKKQMLAAVGQPKLMAMYQAASETLGLVTAQVLLTRHDLEDRSSYLNARNTLMGLLDQGIVPIVNENDTVATKEIKVGDNDNLSALVACLIDAELLILLTDQEGLFTADPSKDPEARLVPEVSGEIPDWLWKAAAGAGEQGTGGMYTKVEAAQLALRSGCTVVIANGCAPGVIGEVIEGKAVGTKFNPLVSALESRKRFILASGRAAGAVRVDRGAERAMRRGGSLLSAGMIGVEGEFDRGETIKVVDEKSKEFARGIVNYTARDLVRLCRRQSDEIESILGYHYGDEIVHHDDLVLL